ncbi:MAG: helix-turn-helix domain-containing protein [Bacteroidales bacterium]|nr:helix-turn-helix domain-containing protein [Bacteroidales bacterium]
MELCHVEEHTSCFQYSTHDAAIEIIELKKNENFQIQSDANQILFVMHGLFDISGKKVRDKKIQKEESILIPLHSPYVITAMEAGSFMVMKLNFNITFCDRLPLELLLELHGKIKKEPDTIGLLAPNMRLTNLVNMIKEYMDDGLKCSFFFDIKIREFLYLIRVYYDKTVVFNFFKPIYSTDFVFSNNIYKNLDDVKTVKELASALNYSLSGFEKKFKRVFNVSPYQWMQEQKAKKIYHEIHCSKKTFTEMAFEYEFSSPAHFNVFCKLFFGQTPGELRKENMERSAVLFT